MTTLKTLADAREEILKAEIAALLHNMGKLDVNFLTTKVEADKEVVSREIEEQLCDIPDYFFDRFAAPDIKLFLKGQEAFGKRWSSEQRQELAAALQGEFTGSPQQAAIEALAESWTQATKDRYPPVARMVEAASRFSEFVTGNGPLFNCSSPDRQSRLVKLRISGEKLKDVRNQISALDQKLDQVRQALDQAPPEQKKPLGLQKGKLNKRKEELLKKQEQAKRAHRTLQQAVPDDERKAQADLESKFRNAVLDIAGEKWPLADLLTLFWDDFFYAPGGNEYLRRFVLADWLVPGQGTALPVRLILSHGVASGIEKATTPTQQPDWKDLRLATAFGYELFELAKWTFLDSRHQLIEKALQALSQAEALRNDFQKNAENALSAGTGDTRRPFNEITLWDYSTSIATLFKATVAQAVLENRFLELKQVKWRLLHVSFDGLAFWGQAHHVTDLLGRRKALEDGLDAVRDLLEVQYPLGNEVYRDEHGSVFVMPDVDNLLEFEDEDGRSLKKLLEEAFDNKGIQGELVPEIAVRPHDKGYEGKKIDLAGVLQSRRRENAPQPDIAAWWWAKDQRPENAEICTVCGCRPVGYVEPKQEPWVTSQKAKDRNVCGVCLHRRGRRARDWARNVKTENEEIGSFERTIWTDEVADEHGRFALVVGRFVLEGWLDGKLIPTMLKSPSFARIRRCWDSTRQFWREVQNEVIPAKVGKRVRLGLCPTNVEHINDPDPDKGLGKWHTYEAEVSGRRLGLCWDPNGEGANDRDLFWTTDNLDYLAAQMGVTAEKLKERLEGRTLPLYEPGGYLGQERRANADAERCQVAREEELHPFIPLMIEPATFMTLVPADKALKVAKAIKAKYDQEMARVRDRLPLHLGIIFAPRRTPVRAVLEAGQAMLEMPDTWEEWRVGATGRKAAFSRNGQFFDWKYPVKMGDSETDDVKMRDNKTHDGWYPHLLTVDPTTKDILNKDAGDFRLVDDLTGTVYIRPSRFDFEFLDTTTRRFEIHYGNDGQRPRRTRPFLLDDLDRLEKLWKEIRNLEKSQCYQVISAIEATREAWFGSDSDCKSWCDTVFRQFVRDTLAGAAWPKERTWKAICQEGIDQQLVDTGVSGELADLAELHMQILKE